MEYGQYLYTVTLRVLVEAPDEHDAEDALKDTFGPGEEPGGIQIVDFEVVDFEDRTED